MLNFEFENDGHGFLGVRKIFLAALKNAEKVLGGMPKFKGRLNGKIILTLTGDAQIKALNKQYRGKNKSTDVLSFSYFGEASFPVDDIIGEVVISIPTAKKQAREHDKTLNEELQFLFVHGLLHVFGYDHIAAGERKIMFDLQEKVLGTKSWREIYPAA